MDNNPQAVQNVNELARIEDLDVRAVEYDLNAANLQDHFDYIVATVVFMFLYPRFVPQVIADMQAHTNPGGYNLIVSAMDTEDFPCPMPFRLNLRRRVARILPRLGDCRIQRGTRRHARERCGGQSDTV